MYVAIYSIIVWIATFIGAITGLGGGIIIKPAFDFVGLDQAVMISVYSTIAVFSMCIVSLYKRWDDVKNSQRKIAFGLSIGSILGGLSGEQIFQMALQYWGNRFVSLSQSILLVIILVGIIVYAFFQEKIATHSLNQWFGIMVLGWSVGLVSVFLGIGGGPLNIVLLLYFFSMKSKEAAFYSIQMIFFAQIMKMGSIVTHLHQIEWNGLLVMLIIIFAFLGGYFGTKIQKKLTHQQVLTCYHLLMILLLFINLYNVYRRL